MTNKTEMVSMPRELLQDLIDSAQLEVDERVRAYGEDYRPHVLAAQRKVVADASAILAAPAEDVRAVGDEPVAFKYINPEIPWPLFYERKQDDHGKWEEIPLYRHPQRPVVLPDMRSWSGIAPIDIRNQAKGWNACLDEYKRLNP